MDEPGHQPACQKKAEGSPAERQHHALAGQLPSDPPAARAECGPQGKLAAPRGGAGKQQIGDVRAADEQQHARGRQQQPEPLARAPEEILDQRRDHHPVPARLCFGIRARDSRDDRVQLGLGLPKRHFRPEPSYRQQEGRAPALEGVGVHRGYERRPEIDAPREFEPGGHHAHDRVGLPSEFDGPAQSLGIGSEPFAPETMAHDHDFRSADPIVALVQDPTEGRRYTQEREETASDFCALDQHGVTVAREDVPLAIGQRGQGRQAREAPALPLPVLELRVGQLCPRAVGDKVLLPGHDEPLLCEKGQGTNDDGMDDAEDRGRGPDREGQGQDGHGAQAAILRQESQAVAQILPDTAEPAKHVPTSRGAPRTGADLAVVWALPFYPFRNE